MVSGGAAAPRRDGTIRIDPDLARTDGARELTPHGWVLRLLPGVGMALFFSAFAALAMLLLVRPAAPVGGRAPSRIVQVRLAPAVPPAPSSPGTDAPLPLVGPAAPVAAGPAAPQPAPQAPAAATAMASARPAHLAARAPAAHAVALAPDDRRNALAASSISLAFRGILLAHLQQFAAYPEAARRDRAQGVVMVLFAMRRDGTVLDVRISSGCGNAALDQAAAATVWRAQPLPPIPAQLPDRLHVLLPVSFAP